MTTVKNLLPEALRVATQPLQRDYKPTCYPLEYNVDGLAPCCEKAHRAVQWWLNDIINKQRHSRRWLTLYGKSGCGKTHLAKASCNCLKAFGKSSVQLWNWSKLRDWLIDGEHPGLMYQVQNMRYLFIDDVGAEYTATAKSAALTASVLYTLLEARLDKWTFLTSNLAPADWADVRITSRLYRGRNELVDMRTACDYCYNLKK